MSIRQPGLLSSIKTYATECFTHRLYWFFFLSTACTYSSRLISTFVNQRYKNSLGLTMQEIGDFNFGGGISSRCLLQFPVRLGDVAGPDLAHHLARLLRRLDSASHI
jgi:hypothetical protein